MDEVVSGIWWVLALQGLCALLFGILGLVSPAVMLLWLLVLFASYALLGGAVAVLGAAVMVGVVESRRRSEDSWLLLLLGLVGSAASVSAVLHPDLTALVLVLLIGANAAVSGLLQIAMGIRLRRIVGGHRILVGAGVASVVFGGVVFLQVQASPPHPVLAQQRLAGAAHSGSAVFEYVRAVQQLQLERHVLLDQHEPTAVEYADYVQHLLEERRKPERRLVEHYEIKRTH
jgi:uncharacterized membrane protein HdeD (DUF308 family)